MTSTSPSVSLFDFSLSLVRPLETARGAIERRKGVLVVVERDGVLGIGEASPLPGWTESQKACKRALERARDETADSDPRAALDTVDAHETPAARHGVAAAFADLEARRAGEPLYRHLGGSEQTKRVPVNATIGDGTPERCARAAEDARADGFRCLKVKVGAREIEADVARLRAIRAVAPTVELRADANGAWSTAEARRAIDAFEGIEGGLAYLEQPLPPTDLAGHATLREEGRIDIALDETLSEHSIGTILERGAADVVICKPMVLGGLDRAREKARRARATGVAPVVTTTIDGAIARAGATHLAASLAPIAPCGLATGSLLETDVVGDDPVTITDGYAHVPRSPGTIGATATRALVDELRP